MGRRIALLATLLLLAATFPPAGDAQQYRSARISYLTADGFYIDAGSGAGLAAGDTVEVMSGADTIARAVVSFVAASSASCAVVEGDPDVLQPGQRVRFHAREAAEAPEEPALSYEPGTTAAEAVPERERRVEPSRERINELDGRISVQLRGQTDAEGGNDVTEPGLSLRLRVRNLWGSHHTLQVYARTRRTLRDRPAGGISDEWNNRVYEVSLEYDDPASPFGYRAGRIYTNEISGIGAFDGALVSYEPLAGWTAGAFGGARPDPRTSRISTSDTKTGAYINYERGDWSARRIDATVALAGSYHEGEIDEEFLYQQLRWSYGRTLMLYESAEFDIRRGWRERAEGSSFGLGNIVLSARWAPVDVLSLDVGYDNRRILRTWETKDTPDSLFDDSVREGWRIGTSVRLTPDIRVYAQGSVRTLGDGDETVTGHLRFGHRNLGHGVGGDVRLAIYDSPFSTGYQPSVTVSMYVLRRARISVELGTRTYEFSDGRESQTDAWLRPSLSIPLGRRMYGHAYVEITRGDMESTNRGFVEVGRRF